VSTTIAPRTPRLPSSARRRLVHSGFTAIALVYLGGLVIAPLIGIAWAAFKGGWSLIADTLRQPVSYTQLTLPTNREV
jgi:ABC-type sulfate transport system permease subunit